MENPFVDEGQDPVFGSVTAAAPVVEDAVERKQSRYNLEFLHKLRTDMLDAAAQGYSALKHVLPSDLACSIIEDAFLLLKAEPTMLEVSYCLKAFSRHLKPQHFPRHVDMHAWLRHCLSQLHFDDPGVEVIVVGDTHGQFHDVCKL